MAGKRRSTRAVMAGAVRGNVYVWRVVGKGLAQRLQLVRSVSFGIGGRGLSVMVLLESGFRELEEPFWRRRELDGLVMLASDEELPLGNGAASVAKGCLVTGSASLFNLLKTRKGPGVDEVTVGGCFRLDANSEWVRSFGRTMVKVAE